MNIANFTSHISNMDRLIERAYSAYMDAPDSVMDIAKDKYYKTLTKCENERAECKDKIEALNVEKLRLENMRTFFNQPTLPKDAIEKAESDPIKMRNLVMELVDKIYPYRITTYVSPATNRIMKPSASGLSDCGRYYRQSFLHPVPQRPTPEHDICVW